MNGFTVDTSKLLAYNAELEKITNEIDKIQSVISSVQDVNMDFYTVTLISLKNQVKKHGKRINEYKNYSQNYKNKLDEIIRTYEVTEKNLVGISSGTTNFSEKSNDLEEKLRRLSAINPGNMVEILRWNNFDTSQWHKNRESIYSSIFSMGSLAWLNDHPMDTSTMYKNNPHNYEYLFSLGFEGLTGGTGDISKGGKNLKNYVESIKDYISWWSNDGGILEGSEKYCKLAENSGKLWKSIYDVIKSYDKSGGIEDKFGNVSHSVGVVSGMAGFFHDVIKISTDDEMNATVRTGEYIKATGKLGDVGKDSTKLVYSMKGNSVPKGLDQYVTLAKTTLATAGQTISSIGKYSADGKWDMNDTAQTMIDSSVTGLDALADGVLKTITFGNIGMSDVRNVTRIPSTERIISDIKDFADKKGKKAANYVLSHPDLNEQFKKGGIDATFAILKGMICTLFS